jgi:hypothetical protein
VGIYEFFETAFIQSKLRDLKTLGGLLGERKSLKQVGLRLIANHHLFLEDLYAKHLPPIGRDAQFGAQVPGDRFGMGLAKALIADSSREAPEVYRLAWTFSAPTLRDGVGGHEYDADKGDDPDNFVDLSKKDALEKFYALESRGAARAAQALAKWQELFDKEHERADPALLRRRAVGRSLALLVPYHAQAAQRRASYYPVPPEKAGIAWGYPAAAAALLTGAAALIWSRLSKRS